MALSPTSSRGGSAAVTTYAAFDVGTAVTIANGASGTLKWDGAVSYSTLMDVSVATVARPLATGVYAVAVTVFAEAAMTVGGMYKVKLALAGGDDNVDVFTESRTASAANDSPIAGLAAVWSVKAAKAITVVVTNRDGANPIDFDMTVAVQRLA